MDNSVIARSGWLLRRDNQTGHNNVNLWTKNWIELYRDGYLKYYESDYSPNAEDIIYMPTECISIKTGSQVECNIRPPEGSNPLCLFSVTAIGNKTWIFCGESLDDMRAWQLALEQARLLIVRTPYMANNHHHPQAQQSYPSNTAGGRLNFMETQANRLASMSRPPNPFNTLELQHSFLPINRDSSMSYLPPSFRAQNDVNSLTASAPIASLYSNLPLDNPCSYNYGYPANPQSTGLQPRYSLMPNQLHNPYIRPYLRDFNSGIPNPSLNHPSGVDPLLWSPFIWW